MRKLTLLLFVVITTICHSQGAEKQDFIGDDFSLEGALAMFKNANSLDDFEKSINESGNNVNNLDLNDDGNIDYITVNDIVENNTHVIVLSTYLSENEKQDIATIGIEKTGNENAVLQIEGDQELYAANTIIEPFETEEKSINSNNGGPNVPEISVIRIVVNVWFWPCVRFVYAPSYIIYVSPHRWGFYPNWFRPWRPFRHHIFYSNCAPHRVFYHRADVCRVSVARKIYAPKRHTTTVVVHHNRRESTINNSRNQQNQRVRTNRNERVNTQNNGGTRNSNVRTEPKKERGNKKRESNSRRR